MLPLDLTPRRVWSLKTLLSFYAYRFVEVTKHLQNLGSLQILMALENGDRKSFDKVVEELRELATVASEKQMNLRVTAYACQRALDQLAEGIKPDQLRTLANDVVECLQADLKAETFIHLTPKEAGLFSPAEPFWSERTMAAFPFAYQEYEEAARCLAFQRHDACAFHLMRALESGLNTLAEALQLPPNSQNWQTLIEGIESAIARLDKSPHPPNWKQELEYYSRAAMSFRYFKNAWRNHVAHGRLHCGPEDAAKLFAQSRDFFEVLGERFTDNG